MTPPFNRHRRRPEDEALLATPWLGAAIDPDVRRVQDWLEALEAESAGEAAARHAAAELAAAEPEVLEVEVPEVEVPDVATDTLGAPLLAGLEARIASAERRAAAAEGLARSADARARAAAARAEDILFALPDLAHELKTFVDADSPGTQGLIEAIERMRARVTSAVAAPRDDDTRVIVIPD